MIKPEVLDALVAAGCTAEQIAAAVKADQSSSSGAARQARYRAKKSVTSDASNVTDRNVTAPPSPLSLPDKEISPTPPKEINLTLSPLPPTREADEFERWYANFPNKVGKGAALKAWPAARKQASFEILSAGLVRYLAKADDRMWCNPATWLNQGRWLDEPATAPPRQAGRRNVVGVLNELISEFENGTEIRADQSSFRLAQDAGNHAAPQLDFKPG